MSVQPFDPTFATEFSVAQTTTVDPEPPVDSGGSGGGVGPGPMSAQTEVLDCPSVEILTGRGLLGLSDPTASVTVPSYWHLATNYATYWDVAASFDDYAAIMYGHAGFPGGATAPGSRGYGMRLGIRDVAGVEWWVTDVEGWDDGPTVDVSEVQSINPGTWIDRVRGRGREVAIKGAVVAPTEALLVKAKHLLAAALASPPHFGVLKIGGLSLPVALTAPPKVKHLGRLMVEFEMTVKGHDVGTPGSGVWREGESRDFVLGSNAVASITNSTFVLTRPKVRFQGPLNLGQRLSDGERALVLAQPLPSGKVLTVDCATFAVELDSTPARYFLTPISRPIELDPQVETVTTSSGTAAAGSITLTVTDLY